MNHMKASELGSFPTSLKCMSTTVLDIKYFDWWMSMHLMCPPPDQTLTHPYVWTIGENEIQHFCGILL